MPKVAVYDITGKQTGEEIELNDLVFGVEFNEAVVHQAIVMQQAAERQGTSATKTRGMVRGGGRKPWRQKGTGHARQGSTRAPQWTHGGIVFAPKPRSYRYTVNKKVRRLALKSALSSKVQEESLVVLDSMTMDAYKTKTVAAMLNALGAEKKALIVLPSVDQKLIKSANNIPGVKTAQVNTINVYDILNADKLIVLKDAVAKIEEVYA